MHQIKIIEVGKHHESYAVTTTYIVEETFGVKWTCTCPAYRHTKKECKHIRNVKASKKADQ